MSSSLLSDGNPSFRHKARKAYFPAKRAVLSEIPTTPAQILGQALDDPEKEAELRQLHRIVLRCLGTPDAKSHHEYASWKKNERNLWLIVQALNERIAARRWDIVIVDPEDMDEHIARFERQVAAEEKRQP